MIHANSQQAYQATRNDAMATRAAIREIYIRRLPGTAITVPEILEEVRIILQDPDIILNSVAPRVSEMSNSEPPELIACGYKEYYSRTGRKLRRDKYRITTMLERAQWIERNNKSQKTLF